MAAKGKNNDTAALTGMRGFWRLLKEVRGLLLWAVGSATIPIFAGLASFYPPWPPAIVPVTSILMVITLVLAFQLLRLAPVTTVNNVLVVSAIIVCFTSTVYLVGLSQFTFTEPHSQLRFVKGFVCTNDALLVYGVSCPWLGDDQLLQAEWEAGRLWTLWSITIIRIALVLLWSIAFVALSFLLGSFIVQQLNVGGQEVSSAASRGRRLGRRK